MQQNIINLPSSRDALLPQTRHTMRKTTNTNDFTAMFWWKVQITRSLRTQTYFRRSLGFAENNVCEPEPGNDFCDVTTIVFPLANEIPWWNETQVLLAATRARLGARDRKERIPSSGILIAMNETPKKIPFGGEICILCKKSFPVAKEKISVFGKSGLNISSPVKHATNVDLSVYVGCEKLAICHTKCYNRLVRWMPWIKLTKLREKPKMILTAMCLLI